MAATGKSEFCIHGGPQRRLIAAAKEFLDLPGQFRYRAIGQRPAWIDHDIPRCRQFRKPGAHNFTDPPLEAIAENGLTNGTGRGEANTRTTPFAGETKSSKERSAVTETVVIYFAEFARTKQPDTLWKACDSG